MHAERPEPPAPVARPLSRRLFLAFVAGFALARHDLFEGTPLGFHADVRVPRQDLLGEVACDIHLRATVPSFDLERRGDPPVKSEQIGRAHV